MEKFLLCGLFSYNELHVINQQNVNISVFFPEFCHRGVVAVTDRFDDFVGKLLTGNVEDPGCGIFFQYKMRDGVHQVGFSESNASI